MKGNIAYTDYAARLNLKQANSTTPIQTVAEISEETLSVLGQSLKELEILLSNLNGEGEPGPPGQTSSGTFIGLTLDIKNLAYAIQNRVTNVRDVLGR